MISNKKIQKLINDISNILIYYLPSDILINIIEDDKINLLSEYGIVDTIIYKDENGTGQLFEPAIHSLKLPTKEVQLANQIILLTEIKNSIPTDAFQLLIQSYGKTLHSWITTTEYYIANCNIQLQNNDVLIYFKTQFNILLDHQKDILNRFCNQNTTQFAKIATKTNNTSLQSNTTNNITILQKQHFAKIATKTKKIKRITQQEADYYLLQTVFGVS